MKLIILKINKLQLLAILATCLHNIIFFRICNLLLNKNYNMKIPMISQMNLKLYTFTTLSYSQKILKKFIDI